MATILLTGHSRGLGAAMTQQLLTAGHRVIGFSRSPITSLGPALTERLHEIPINLADPLEIEGALNPGVLADLLRDQSQKNLINNAGLLSPIGFAGSLSTAEILQSVTANTAAAIPSRSMSRSISRSISKSMSPSPSISKPPSVPQFSFTQYSEGKQKQRKGTRRKIEQVFAYTPSLTAILFKQVD